MEALERSKVERLKVERMSLPEKRARAIIEGNEEQISLLKEAIVKNDRKTVLPIFFAFKALYEQVEKKDYKNIGDALQDPLTTLLESQDPDPSIVGGALALLTMYKSTECIYFINKLVDSIKDSFLLKNILCGSFIAFRFMCIRDHNAP